MEDDPILTAALVDRDRVLARLRKNPDYQRLSQIEEIIRLLKNNDSAPEYRTYDAPQVVMQPVPAPANKTTRIADAVEAYLRKNPGWQTAAEIYNALVAQGVEIGGQNPRSNLTAHMSSAGRFVSDRTRGWRLKGERGETGGATIEERSDAPDALVGTTQNIFQ